MFDRKKYDKEYCFNYKETRKECTKQWRIDHPGYIEQYNREHKKELKNYKREYYQNNIDKIREYQNNPEYIINRNLRRKKRKKIDLKFNLNCKINRMINHSLKRDKAHKHWEDLIGYKIIDLIKHLKKTMPEGYTWQDYLEGKLEVDHKIPISAFNFTKPEHVDFKKCWDLKNLRLLPKKENRTKGNRLDKPFQPSLKLCLVD